MPHLPVFLETLKICVLLMICVPGDLGTVSKIAAGPYNTCAIKNDGADQYWGSNSSGHSTVPSDFQ